MSYNLQVICDKCGEITSLPAKTVGAALGLCLEWMKRVDVMMSGGASPAMKINTLCPPCAEKVPMQPHEMRTNSAGVIAHGAAVKRSDG